MMVTDSLARARTRTALQKLPLLALILIGGLAFAALNGTWAYSTPARSLDGSWAYVLHTLAGHVQFGSELIFTYGPLGFLIALGDTPSTYVWRMVFEAALLLYVYWQLYLLRFRGEDAAPLTPGGTLLLLLVGPVGISFAFFGRDLYPDGAPVLALTLSALNLVRLAQPGDLPQRLAIGFTLAILALVKGTLIPVVCLLAALLLLRRVVFKRGQLDGLWAMGGSFLVIWLLSGNALADLPRFFWAMKEIASGFSTGMQTGGPSYLQTRGLFLMLSLVFAARFALAAGKARLERGLIAILIALIGLMLTKHATDRFDGHVFTPAFVMLALSFITLLMPRSTLPGKCLSGLAIALALLTVNFALKSQVPQMTASERVRWIRSGDQFVPHIRGQQILLANLGQSVQDEVGHFARTNARLAHGLPEVPAGQSIDLYSFRQGALLAANMNYRPRPVFQSYSVYTPWLAEQNRAFLRSERAPERIFFGIEPIDQRQASMEDGLSWFDLIARYQLKGTFGFAGLTHLDLLKRAQPGAITLDAPKHLSAELNEWVSLPPATTMSWATATPSRRSLHKALMAQIIRSPIYWMEFELADGRVARKRVIEPLLHSGLLMSPLVDSTKDFLAMVATPESPQIANKAVKRFRIQCEPANACPISQWDVAVSNVSIDTDPSWRVATPPRSSTFKSPLDAIEAGVVTESDAQVRPEEGKTILFAHATTVAVAQAKDLGLEHAKHAKVCFGILHRAYEQDGNTHGVDFEIQEDAGEPYRRSVWGRSLKPLEQTQDRGEQCAIFPLSGKQTELAFLTKPSADIAWAWSYWSSISRVD